MLMFISWNSIIKVNTQDAGEIWRSVLLIPEFDWGQSEIQRHNPHCSILGHNLEVQLKTRTKQTWNHFPVTCITKYCDWSKKFLHQLFLPCTAKANNSAASSKVMGNLPWRISLFICRKNWYLLKIECLVKTTCKGKTNLVMGNEVLSWNFIKKKTTTFWIKVKIVIKNRLIVYTSLHERSIKMMKPH